MIRSIRSHFSVLSLLNRDDDDDEADGEPDVSDDPGPATGEDEHREKDRCPDEGTHQMFEGGSFVGSPTQVEVTDDTGMQQNECRQGADVDDGNERVEAARGT